jgi:hypothetical protein
LDYLQQQTLLLTFVELTEDLVPLQISDEGLVKHWLTP